MAEIRVNATGGLKLYDADDSHYAQIIAGTITSNVDAITLGHDTVTIADNLSLGSDSAVLKFGADGDTTLTHTDGTGLTLNSTNKICFNDASQFIQGSSNAILALGATDEIDLTATAVDLNGTLDVSGNSQFSGTITVGVDDTGKDVKLFGASAGAYMEWDESADQLRIMGASADATTSTGKLLLATSLTNINANDVIGKIEFQAPHEAGGTDAITVAASIQAVAQSTFSSSSNATDLIFSTGHSEAAAEKIRITSQNEIGIAGANYGTDGQVLTSGGAGAAAAWEDASGAVTALNNATANEIVTVGATTTELDAESLLTFNAASDPPLLLLDGVLELIHTIDAPRFVTINANRGAAGDELGGMSWEWNGTEVAKIASVCHTDTTNKDDASLYIHTRTSGSAIENSVRFQFNQTNCFSNNDSFASTYLMDINGTGTIMRLNRADDGAMLLFQSAGSTEGNVSISGSTCTYTTFTGAHWSQLSDNSKPTILQGTVMETINEMCDWYVVEFLNKEGKTVKEQHLLQEGQSAGDVINYTYEGETVKATIVKEENNNLAKVKISDSEDSKAVYGVFQTWDEDNDMNVVGLGTFVVRIHSGETVAIGDLLSSKGDGTAKVQADDIIRSRTIAKVTSTIKQTTYADDSYTVPCTLHCG
jgi:hypothetical protein|tara:strand:- start:178 stop:2133 length:1956 start_codon:yes stop_codon:yes gene_type:complete